MTQTLTPFEVSPMILRNVILEQASTMKRAPIWRTGTFQMTVDVDKNGFAYQNI